MRLSTEVKPYNAGLDEATVQAQLDSKDRVLEGVEQQDNQVIASLTNLLGGFMALMAPLFSGLFSNGSGAMGNARQTLN